MTSIRLDDRLTEQQMAEALQVRVDELRALIAAGYVPDGVGVNEWARETLEAFLPLWDLENRSRRYTACRCVAAFERLADRPCVLGRCNECGTMYLSEGLWLRTGELVRYFNEAPEKTGARE